MDFPATGIRELDAIALQFGKNRGHSKIELVDDNPAKKELEQIQILLSTIDRRRSAMGCDSQPISLAARLREVLIGYGADLESNVQQVVTCSSEINRCTAQMVTDADEQTVAVNRTTGHIESLSTHIMSVGETAEAAVSSSSVARESAMTSLEKFKKLIDELTTIQKHVAARERKLRALGQHSKEIGSIVQTIGTLSSRTDLLALNASIESVRAGEHGRGFAIVADEVRALAEQSAQAVQDITSRIELMQLETQESISVASGEHDQMNQVIQRVNSTLDVLSEISDAAANCATNVSDIFTSNQQQLRLLQSIVVALEETSEFAKSHRIQAEGVHWTAKTMGQVGSQLSESLQMVRSAGGASFTAKIRGDSPQSENTQFSSELVSA